MQYVLIIPYHRDPGHGWLEVPSALVLKLGFRNQISEYSYLDEDRQLFYLEEDCDAALLIDALKSSGIEYVFRDVEHKDFEFFSRNFAWAN